MNSMYIALNMLKRTLGQKKGILFYILTPVLVVSLITGLLGQTPSRLVTIAYVNQDQGPLGKHLIHELSLRQEYVLKDMGNSDTLKETVIKQQAEAAFCIPANFSASFYKIGGPQLDMYQLSINESTFTLKIYLDSIIGQLKKTISAMQATSMQPSEIQAAVDMTVAQIEKHQIKASVTDYNLYLNPGLSTIIGFMLVFMMGLISSTVTVVLDDRRQRTLARTFTAPVRTFEIVLGNFLGSFMVGTLQIVFILSITRYLIRFDYHLPFFSQFIVMEFFLLASMGIASATAGLMKNATNIGALNSLIITPTCMLGGCFWPVSIMPDWMQMLSNFVPQKWAIDAIERMSTGQGLADIGLNIGVLALFALILLGMGSVILRPEEVEVG